MRKVAVIVQSGVHSFGLGVNMEVWAEPYHPDDDNPVFDVTVCTPEPGRVPASNMPDLLIDDDLTAVHDADLVTVVPHDDTMERGPDPAVIEALNAAQANGATIAAHCTAVFDLGFAGLLDGRDCTTHWRYGRRLAELFPEATVTPDVLYVHDGPILTGAGSAAGLDAFLYLMRRRFGSAVAATAARRIVVPPHRDGGQCQFVKTPVAITGADTLAPVLQAVGGELNATWTVERMARRALLTPRTFARRFKEETGTTPLQWLTLQRVALAEELLETTGKSIEEIADRCGFGSGATLRHHFHAVRGTTPMAYRRSFGVGEPAEVGSSIA